MSKKVEKILVLADNFEQKAAESLVAEAKKKDSKKLDPKAKVRNRGTACVPAERAKDKKDHFPINDADQARNALARVKQYSSAPSWWSGSLKGLQDLVARKVKAKYPKIDVGGKKEKKSFLDTYEGLIYKFGQAQQVQQPDGTWVAADDDTDVTDGQKVRKWDGAKWEVFKYRAVDQALVPEKWDYGQPGKVTHNPTPQTDQDAKNFIAGKGAPSGAGGGGGKPNYGTGFDQEMVKKMQGYLNKNKFNAGPEDGKLGPQTAGALKRFQKSVGIPETGQMDRATFEKLAPFIPEFKSLLDNEPGKTVKAPVSSERASALIDQAYDAIEKLLPAYQSGQMMQNKAAWLAYLTPFYQSIGPLYQQINALVNSPQIDPEQKKEFQALLPKLNQSAMALSQYYQILTGQAPGQPAQPAAPPPAAK